MECRTFVKLLLSCVCIKIVYMSFNLHFRYTWISYFSSWKRESWDRSLIWSVDYNRIVYKPCCSRISVVIRSWRKEGLQTLISTTALFLSFKLNLMFVCVYFVNEYTMPPWDMSVGMTQFSHFVQAVSGEFNLRRITLYINVWMIPITRKVISQRSMPFSCHFRFR